VRELSNTKKGTARVALFFREKGEALVRRGATSVFIGNKGVLSGNQLQEGGYRAEGRKRLAGRERGGGLALQGLIKFPLSLRGGITEEKSIRGNKAIVIPGGLVVTKELSQQNIQIFRGGKNQGGKKMRRGITRYKTAQLLWLKTAGSGKQGSAHKSRGKKRCGQIFGDDLGVCWKTGGGEAGSTE